MAFPLNPYRSEEHPLRCETGNPGQVPVFQSDGSLSPGDVAAGGGGSAASCAFIFTAACGDGLYTPLGRKYASFEHNTDTSLFVKGTGGADSADGIQVVSAGYYLLTAALTATGTVTGCTGTEFNIVTPATAHWTGLFTTATHGSDVPDSLTVQGFVPLSAGDVITLSARPTDGTATDGQITYLARLAIVKLA